MNFNYWNSSWNNFHGSSRVVFPIQISSNFLSLPISKSEFRTVDGFFLRWFTVVEKRNRTLQTKRLTRSSSGRYIATGVRVGHQRNRGLFPGSGNRFFCSQQLLDMPCVPRSLLFNEQRALLLSSKVGIVEAERLNRSRDVSSLPLFFMACTGRLFYSTAFWNVSSTFPLC